MKKLNTNMLVLILLTILWLLSSCSIQDLTLPGYTENFEKIIADGKTPSQDAEIDEFSKTIFDSLPPSTALVARYVTESGTGNHDGTSWTNAWAGADLRNKINDIQDASATKVYVVLVAGGTYKPTTGSDQTVSFSMKNYVAIVGGFDESGRWEYTGNTVFSGNIGDERNATDNSYHVFYHQGGPLDSAILYGVTITDGNATGKSPNNQGGGMYNNDTSPRIVNTVFEGNEATEGGGMYNEISNPNIINTVFRDNTAQSGGGMYNKSGIPSGTTVASGSLPEINHTVFEGNEANEGGGMYNYKSNPNINNTAFRSNTAQSGGGMYNADESQPKIQNTIFSDNSATNGKSQGGGMYNGSQSSLAINSTVFSSNSAKSGGGIYNNLDNIKQTPVSAVLINTVFSGNSASQDGGGMYNDDSTVNIVNAVFIDNRANRSGKGTGGGIYIKEGGDLSVYNSIFYDNVTPNTTGTLNDISVNASSSFPNIQVVGSVLGIGAAHPTNSIVADSVNQPINITYTSLANKNPGTRFTAKMKGISYTSLSGGTGAKDLGLYLKEAADIYYISKDNNSWYTEVDNKGDFIGTTYIDTYFSKFNNPKDRTLTDFNGKARTGRPDAGVIEE